jgi:hypothetical protein
MRPYDRKTRNEHQHTGEIDDRRDLRVVQTRLDEWEFRHDHHDHRWAKQPGDSSRLGVVHGGLAGAPGFPAREVSGRNPFALLK